MASTLYSKIVPDLFGKPGVSLVNSIFVDAMQDDDNAKLMEKLDALEKKLDELKQQEK